MTKPKKTAAFDVVTTCCRVLDDKKAEAITILDVSAQSSITDFLVIATATSEPHLRALRIELEKAFDSAGTRIVGIEMAQASGWVVIDVFDVMVHLFLGDVREHYRLDRLWQDAVEIPLSTVFKPTVRRKAPAGRAKQTAKAGRKGKQRKRASGSK